MARWWDKGLRVLVSASLVMGLVPTSALAEALEDDAAAAAIETEAVLKEVPEMESTETSDAEVEEVPADEEASEPSEIAPAEEESFEAVDSVLEEEGSSESAAVEDTEVESVAASDQATSLPIMQLDEGIEVTVEDGGFWVGEFTAPATDTYRFYSEGGYDTYGHLYSDADLTSELISNDDDGEGNNFAITYSLEEGQTVYLKARQFSDGAMTCTVSVCVHNIYDLATASINIEQGEFDETGEPVSIRPHVYNADDAELVEGTDYIIAYTDSNYQPIDSVPSSHGGYYIYAIPAEGSAYTGRTGYAYFFISGNKNLANAKVKLDRVAYEVSGAPVSLEIGVYDADGNWIEQGDTYVFAYFDADYNRLEEAPSEVGQYYVAAVPADGSDFYGQTPYAAFRILSSEDMHYDISSDYIQKGGDSNTYAYTGEPVVGPELTFWYYETDEWGDEVAHYLTEGVDYERAYYSDYSSGERLDSAPVEIGSYYVTYRGIGSYSGEFSTVMNILDMSDLSSWYISYASCYLPLVDGEAKPYSLYVQNGLGEVLVEGQDYEFVYVNSSTGVELSGRPTAVGDYNVYAKAVEGSGYQGETSQTWVGVFDTVNQGVLEEGVEHAVSIGSDQLWLGSFVASEDGSYTITASGFGDVTGALFDDATITNMVDKQGGYGADTLVMTRQMAAGDTVYLLLNHPSAEPIDGSVTFANRMDSLTELHLDESVQASCGQYATWDAVFTAPESGSYLFTSEGDQETVGQLFSGIDMSEPLNENYGGGEQNNFYMVQDLEAGQTVYLRVSHANNESLDCKVLVTNRLSAQLSQANFYIDQSQFEPGAVDVRATVIDSDNNTLVEGVHYQLAYFSYDSDAGQYTRLEDVPTTIGEYYVRAEAIEGGGYTGNTHRCSFTIIDPYDLAYFYGCSYQGSSNVVYTGSAVEAPTITYIYRYTPSGEEVSLYPETDFVISGYVMHTDEGDVPVDEPIEIGSYAIVLEGTGAYHGTRSFDFSIIEANDLSSGRIDWYEYVTDGTGLLFPRITVRDAVGTELVEGEHYELEYRVYDDETYDYRTLDGVPTEPGYYEVRAVALDDGGYKNATGYWGVDVLSAYDLSMGSMALHQWRYDVTGKPIVLDVTVTDYAGNELTLGEDYQLVFYPGGDYDNPLSEVPSAVGSYMVRAVAIDGGRYTGQTSNDWFDIVDPHDIGGDYWQCYFNTTGPGSTLAYTGNPIELPSVRLYYYGSENTLYLTEGTDFEVTGFVDAEGNTVEEVVECGQYEAIISGKGAYHGTRRLSFEVADPHDVSYCNVSFANYSYEHHGLYYYFLREGEVKPNVTVWSTIDGRYLTEGTDYVVTYKDNDAAGTATAVITGVGDFYGTVEWSFGIVETMPLSQFMDYVSTLVRCGTVVQRYSEWYGTIQYTATGHPIMPTVSFSFSAYAANGQQPIDGVDFVTTYVDSAGNEVTPVEAGQYRIVLTAVEGGLVTGSAEIPFEIVATQELENCNAYLASNTLYTVTGADGVTCYTVSGPMPESQVKSLGWTLMDKYTNLMEGVDYLVTYAGVRDEVYHSFELTGTGNYTGTIKAEVYVAEEQETFAARDMYVNSWHVSPYYGSMGINCDDEGVFIMPEITIDDLTQGVDYLVDGLYDIDGRSVTKSSDLSESDPYAYLKVVGIGAYEGCERTVKMRPVQSDNSGNLSNLDITNGWYSYSRGVSTNEWHLLKGLVPNVAVTVYGSSVVLEEGRGITVATQIADDGSSMDLTVSDDGHGMLSNSVPVKVVLDDKYDLNDLGQYVYLMDSIAYGSESRAYAWIPGSDLVVTLPYAGFAYKPTAVFAGMGSAPSPTFDVSVRDATGNVTSGITGPGSCTVVLTGTGDWTGTVEVPVNVVARSSIDIANCTLIVDDAELSNGKAEPAVTLSYGDHVFVQGIDYTVAYGNNTEAGARAYVKVSAVAGGKLAGVRSETFTVPGATALTDLSSGQYTLYVQDPSQPNRYNSVTSRMRVYNGSEAQPAKPQVIVRNNVEYTAVDPSNYEVTYGNNAKTGIAYVAVTGKGDYSGTLSANFYVMEGGAIDISAATIATIPQQVYSGSPVEPKVTVTLDGRELSEGADYVVEYSGNSGPGRATATVTGAGPYGGSKSATFRIVPAAPTGARASATSSTTVGVSWEAPAGADFVEVWRSTDPEAPASKSAMLGIYNASAGRSTSRLLSPGTTYYYKVRAYAKVDGAKYYSGYSEIASATTRVDAPTAVSAAPSSATTAAISWSAQEGADFVEVWRSTDPSCAYGAKGTVCIGIYNASDGASTSKLLTPGTTYYYKCRAYVKQASGRKVYSPYSEVVSARPTLSAPTGVSATARSATTVGISWEAPAGASFVEVWRSTDPSCAYGAKGTVCIGIYNAGDGASTSKLLTPGTTYYYKCRAYVKLADGKKVYSGYSSVVSATPR